MKRKSGKDEEKTARAPGIKRARWNDRTTKARRSGGTETRKTRNLPSWRDKSLAETAACYRRQLFEQERERERERERSEN